MAKTVLCFLAVFFAVVVVVTEGCECERNDRGCHIKKPASPGKACKCTEIRYLRGYNYVYGCNSQQVDCKNPDIYECRVPNRGYCCCIQAPGGNCEGYKDKTGC